MNPPLLPPSLDDTPSDLVTSQQVHEYRAIVKDKFHDAMDSTIYVCGMTALDHDDPCYDMFYCDPSLECDSHVESDFCISRIQPKRLVLCFHCTGNILDSLVELHTHLKAP